MTASASLHCRKETLFSRIWTRGPWTATPTLILIKVEEEALLLDRRSIDISGAQEKEGHFHYKNFLRASKRGITCHTCSIILKSLYCGLGLIPILSKGIWG